MHTTSQPTLFPAEQKPQEETPQWFVMRDLKRANAKLPAYKQLAEAHIEVFTPMRWRIATCRGAQIREEKPFVRDLLFAHATRSILDPIVERTPTLQYRYVRGAYCQPMVVKDKDMQRFIGAVEASDTPRFYLPGELSAAQCGQMIRIIGGPLNGYEGRLLSIRGSKTKRLLIELPGILSVGVEVEPEYIQLIKDNKQKYNQIQNKKKPDYNMEYKRNIIITGGAGFIGSHVVRLFVNKYPDYHIINVDKLTYAGNLANLKDIENKPNYSFVKADICDFETICQLMEKFHVDGIIHLAAESHVDRSIKDPFTFARTNVMGTLSLLQAAKLYWEAQPERYEGKRFYHISTDEVYGALELTHPEGIKSEHSAHRVYGDDFFEETTKYNPHSPYSASKASSDHFVRAFHDTYGMPTVVTNCSNNYGPYQFPEKLIPRLALRRGSCPCHRPHLPQRPDCRHLQYRRLQRMEEHRHHQGHHQDRGSSLGQSRRAFAGLDYIRDRPQRARHALRDRFQQTAHGTRLGTLAAIRGRHRKDRSMVLGQSGMDGQCDQRRLPEVLRGNVQRKIRHPRGDKEPKPPKQRAARTRPEHYKCNSPESGWIGF